MSVLKDNTAADNDLRYVATVLDREKAAMQSEFLSGVS